MSDNDHWHYVSDIHDGAEQYHRHYDLERDLESAQQDIRGLQEDVRELRSLLDNAIDRIGELESAMPEARQAQYEADVAVADLAVSGYDDEPDPHDFDPGAEVDDEGGASEHRYLITPEEPC